MRAQRGDDRGPAFDRAQAVGEHLRVGAFEFGHRAQHAGCRPAGGPAALRVGRGIEDVDLVAGQRELDVRLRRAVRHTARTGIVSPFTNDGTILSLPRWMTANPLPAGLDATAMLPRAVAALVAYVPGVGFYADGQGRDSLRLSYCYPEPDRIREGVRRLAGVVEAELEVAETFGSPVPRADREGPASPRPDLA